MNNYRLYFGQSTLRNSGHAMTETINQLVPTGITFGGRNQEDADKKARAMAIKMHLCGTAKAIEEATP